MRTIQEVGTEILTKDPQKLYVMVGPEYGIKMKYVKLLKEFYGELKEVPTVKEVLNMMSKKHLVPIKPCVYIVRYDESFVQSLNEAVRKRIQQLNILGTLVCIYDNAKHAAKLDKFLPEYTVSVDTVNSKYLEKYLHQDFPGIADRFVNIAIECSSDYGQAQSMCRAMKCINPADLYKLSDSAIGELFGHHSTSTESQLRKGIAARNFKYLVSVIDGLEDMSNVYYVILQTMIDLDKLKDSKYGQSDIRDYAKNWTREDIYHMFTHTYAELKKSRTYSMDISLSVIYLFSLLQFTKVPSLEVLS